MVNNLELITELFLGRQAVVVDIGNRLAFHPNEDRSLKQGDVVTVEYVGLCRNKVLMGWKCDPKFNRENGFLGRNWNAIPVECFDPRPYEPPLDWRVSLEKIIPNC